MNDASTTTTAGAGSAPDPSAAPLPAGSRPPVAGSRGPEAGGRPPAAEDRQPAAGDQRPEPSDQRPDSGDRQPAPGSQPASTDPANQPAPLPRSRKGLWIGGAAVLVVAIALIAWRFLDRGTVETDDAFIDGRIAHLAFSVPGRVQAVHVADNQHVEAGAAIAEIDPASFRAAFERAQAELASAQARREAAAAARALSEATVAATLTQAKAEVVAAQARVASAQAEVAAAASASERAEADRQRFAGLASGSATAQQIQLANTGATAAAARLDAARTDAAAAQAAVGAAQARQTAAEAGPRQIEAAQADLVAAEAAIGAARAALAARQVDLDNARLSAPFAGRVTRKQVEPGDYAPVGAPLVALVGDELWVTANYKETDLQRMKPGQRARLHVDAFDRDLDGVVDSLQAGSGTAFSLLPAENATGNYVKVVQRVPVKITFAHPPTDLRLGPGMSVVVKVAVE